MTRGRMLPVVGSVLVVLAVTAGCGGDELPSGESTPGPTLEPSRTPTLEPTRTLPSPTRTRPTQSAEPSESATEPIEPPERPGRPEPTPEPTAEPTPEPTPEPTAAPSTPSGGTSSQAPAAASTSPTQPPTTSPPPAPVCVVPPALAGQDLTRLPVTDKVVALTFDAGANADGVPSIRATLRDEKVRATFFLTGSFVKTFPKKSKRIAEEFLVGNHTTTHPDLTELTDDEIRVEVRTAQRRIKRITGEDPRRFFRFPFGARTPHTIEVLNDLCYVPFRWTVDSLGWQGTSGGQTRAKVVDRVLHAAAPGAIVLMHVGSNPNDGTTLDAAALPEIIDGFRDLGYRMVRLSRIMAATP